MAISITLLEYLEWKGVDYEIVEHPRTHSSMQTAEVAHVPGDSLAKGVVLEDERGYLMAVLPATHRIQLGRLHHKYNRQLGLATEDEIAGLFNDCDTGAIPPVGDAYGFDVVIDDSLTDSEEIFFEAGDHTDLVHVSGADFRELMSNADHDRFSRHV